MYVLSLFMTKKNLLIQSNIMFSHTFKEGNQCADFMTKRVASCDGLLLHEAPPLGLIILLISDVASTFILRLAFLFCFFSFLFIIVTKKISSNGRSSIRRTILNSNCIRRR